MIQSGKNRLYMIAVVICLVTLMGCANSTTDSQSAKANMEYKDENHELTVEPSRKEYFENTKYELISEETKEDYLERHGVKDIPPVCFSRQGGQPRAELYFDKETGQGCGLKYEETEDGTELLGFKISGYYSGWKPYWSYPNPYSTNIVEHTETYVQPERIPFFLWREITDFEEFYEYGLEGELSTYKIMGFVDKDLGNVEREEIFKVKFSYREDGSLQEKRCWFNQNVSTACVEEQYCVYDETERLLYADLQGEGEFYFCYEEDAMTPYACLELEPLGSFYRLEVEDHGWMDVPKGGEEAFLRQAGLTKQDLFYEYQWHNESSFDTVIWAHDDVCLTLYYDKEKEVGCGYLEYPEESLTDMRGFMFKGCEKVDCREIDPYAVYASYYNEQEDIYNRPLEELLGYETWQIVFSYDNDRLMRILMWDTERIYIYDGDSDHPSYCLNLVEGTWPGITLFEFVQSELKGEKKK